MIENVPDIDENIDVEKVLSNLSQQYPQMYLNYPLVCNDFEYGYLEGMNSYEFKFASYLVSNSALLIFREPKIEGCGIPYVILYRQQLENIRQRCIKNLF